jgi:CubicO group peptidase (beta-lactamase class C family)
MSEIHSACIRADGTLYAPGAVSARFPWWSFTKTALAVCALRLVEEGALQLDTRRPGKPFTLRQLLQHRAGVPNYGGLRSYHDAVARGDQPWPRDDLLEAVRADHLDFTPGTDWAYSNVGYMFVNDAIEEATGLDAGDALRKFVLAPLGLPSVKWAAGSSDFSDVHWLEARGYHPGWVYHGCLTGTATDAAKLLHAVFDEDILTEQSRAAMLSAHPLGGALSGRPWTQCGYGLGVMSGKMGRAGRAIGHSGAGPFAVNAVYHFPDSALAVTVAVFTDGTNEARAENEAYRLALTCA